MDYDILIVGSGPAGQHAAWQAAGMGKKAAMIERKPNIGGAGLQTGTIPSKALREAAFLASRSGDRGMRQASPKARFGVMADAVRRKDNVIAQQESVILKRLLQSGVALIPGEASFVDAHTLNITDSSGASRQLSADVIILATGSRPRRPSDIPFDKQAVLDSTSILKLKRLPGSLVVIGGGVIGCEFVSIFAALGVEVSIVNSHEQLLSYLSEDVVEVLADSFENMGVQLHMNERVVAIRKENDAVLTLLESGKKLYADAVLYALGREPNSQTLNTANAGIDLDHGWIAVNEYFQSSIPHIYAVGDLIGRPALASTGMEQGRSAVIHAFSGEKQTMAKHLPMAIYAIPEISWVGKTEKEARREKLHYVVGRGYYRESARGQILGDCNGLVKLIVDVETHRLIGAHIVGEHASELIHTGQLLMNFNGTVHDLAGNVFNYPTLAECYKLAAIDCLNRLKQLS
ncbi:MAG: Si-specific NAD(P)(+) transhydrogenase [Mariprofundus sp.]